jgi:SAM-dependent methyltransferase
MPEHSHLSISAFQEPPMSRSTSQAITARRTACLGEVARGIEQFLGPRRESCPWCGSGRLRTRVRTPDLLRHRPGHFTVDGCRDCGHAFQNPPLSTEGLAFHHRDLAESPLEAGESAPWPGLARATRRRHRAAARAMLPYGEPESWLDVGTGYGHFPAAAREFFPYTSFDGLDTTGRVEWARAEGRVEEGHRGHLTDPHVVARLRARYDVVSMLHHLPRVPGPRAELRAALAVLRPGGRLLLELPDPGCLFARLLGRWWVPYDQPRQLHLPTVRNLTAELAARGCEVLAVDRTWSHVPGDLTAALTLALSRAAPAPDTPWRPAPPSPPARTVRRAVLGAGAPLVAAGAAVDHALAPALRHTRFANTFRIVAQRP